MKNLRFKNYIYWGITALAVIGCSLALAFFLTRFDVVKGTISKVVNILMPIIYGAVLAYLLLPVYNKSCKFTREYMLKGVKNQKVVRGISKFMATLISLVVLVVIVGGLFSMVIPQIYESILGLQANLQDNLNNVSLWLRQLLDENPSVEQMFLPLNENLDLLGDRLETWLTTYVVPNMSVVITGISNSVVGMFVVMKNAFIGVIVMVYLLNIKESLAAQGKKIIYSVFSLRNANSAVEEVRFVHKVFGGFITGKLLDSLIIGIITFVILKLVNMPYYLLVSVIIGVTNVIPFFGPFIGAIPSAFLILLVSPTYCFYFLIFVLLLQQFDGNILGPKILGQSTGLPSFWVLFSILLFGGLFGFVGMIIAVPTFAVGYSVVKRLVNHSLAKKSLSRNTHDYEELTYIDEEKKTYIK